MHASCDFLSLGVDLTSQMLHPQIALYDPKPNNPGWKVRAHLTRGCQLIMFVPSHSACPHACCTLLHCYAKPCIASGLVTITSEPSVLLPLRHLLTCVCRQIVWHCLMNPCSLNPCSMNTCSMRCVFSSIPESHPSTLAPCVVQCQTWSYSPYSITVYAEFSSNTTSQQ